PNPGCPSEANPHDMQLKGEALVSAMASSLEICLNDPGVGVSSAPAEICFTDADCEDGNPCTHNSCDPTTGRCQAAPEPDGIPCDDGDACTLGNACASGTCGTPLSCNDGNACTTDTCDPATGGCTSIPVQCDDANPCTSDFCNADTGRCLFSPMVGTACD